MRKDPYWDPQPYFLGSVVAMVQATRMLRAEAPRGLRNIPIFIIQVRGEGGARRGRGAKGGRREGAQRLLRCR